MNSSRGVEITIQTGSVASAPWPALGGSCTLIGQLQEPRYQEKADVATLAPNVWLEYRLLGSLSSKYGPRTVRSQSPVVDNVRPATAPEMMPKDVAFLEVVDDSPRSAPVS